MDMYEFMKFNICNILIHNPCVYGHLIFVQNISQIMEYDAIFINIFKSVNDNYLN